MPLPFLNVSGLIAIMPMAYTSVPCWSAPDPVESDLMQRAHRITSLPADVRWAALLPSGQAVLYLRVSDSYRFTFVKRDLRTGTDMPIRALNKLHNSSLGYGFDVS